MVKKGRVGLDKNYFVWPHPLWMLILGTLVPFILVTAFFQPLIPPSLGVLKSASAFVYENFPHITWFTAMGIVGAHVLETLCTIKLCWDAGMTTTATIKWTISTAIFGFASIQLRLRPYLQTAKRAQP